MIEGKVCYEELGGPLPDRGTVVLSSDATKTFSGASTASSLEAALKVADKLPYDGTTTLSFCAMNTLHVYV